MVSENKIVIYGVDSYTRFVIQSIRENNRIVGITDTYSNFNYIGKYEFIPASKLLDIEFDYIIITSRERGVRDAILNGLLNKGIEEKKIISFFEIFHEEKVDKVMKKYPDKCYDGLIIGLSHAAKGINPQYLSGEWVNLASSAEDLFYHYEVIKKCFSQYKEHFVELKHIVIDMFDYTNFSYDTSLSSQAICYWADGGCAELHNFNSNKLFSNNIEKEMSEELMNYPAYYPRHNAKKMELRKYVFNEKYVYSRIGRYFSDLDPSHLGYEDFPCEMQNKGHIQKNPMIPGTLLLRENKDTEIYKKTEEENIKTFNMMINYIRETHPDTKIILTLLPRYATIEYIHRNNPYIQFEKQRFAKYIKDVVDNQTVYFVNYKEETMISENNYLWRDLAHLNYQGSIVMTTLYEQFISQLK